MGDGLPPHVVPTQTLPSLQFREEVNAAMAAGGGGMPDVEDALAEMQEQLLIAAQERQLMERQTQERAGE